MVMDARTGEVLHSRNADTRLHPASLTKMMTLYIAFQAVERGEITLDTPVRISRNAAAEPPSKLGLRAGQSIRLRFLLRAAAVKSANDASTAIAEAISGSEEAFATRMNRTARAMGMTNTTFRNAHGLTQSGHMSTARDMTLLGRHVIYDFPQYYNLFSRRSADAGIATVRHTNRRWLDSYRGGDGIKTGYTRAAGFNLVASAQRGQERVIATVFGGSSTAARNARITELMNMGFQRAPTNASLRRPTPPGAMIGNGGRTIRPNGLVSTSMRPIARPQPEAPTADILLSSVETDVIDALVAETVTAAVAAAIVAPLEEPGNGLLATGEPAVKPIARPSPTASPAPETVVLAAVPQPADVLDPAPAEVVTRISTSGGRHWGINVGRYNSRFQAERVLLQVALNEMSSLDGALRRVVQRSGGFDANFMGLTREGADLACRRLQARGTQCFMIGSDG
ncbi:D-alanyl-D-alanine carboxypeptidase family protein [Yoonia litorea]|nr:serine hydrolase [Yoonia litorea]